MNANRDFSNIRERVKQPNFVYAVGYSFERLHSGILAYLMKSEVYGPSLIADLSESRINPSEVSDISVQREHKLGKGCVVDLTATVKMKDDSYRHFVCEYKVDGTSSHDEQCNRIRNNWTKDGATEFLLITPGGAGFWDVPNPFRQINVHNLLSLLPRGTSMPLVEQYISSLEDEQLRREVAHQVIADPERKALAAKLGYRTYDLWYDYYGQLKQKLPDASRGQWSIYASAHNAVMCWMPSWNGIPGEVRNKCRSGRLYCELNNSDLVLKIRWENPAEWQAFIAALEKVDSMLQNAKFRRTRRFRQPHETDAWARMPLPPNCLGNPADVAVLLHNFTAQAFLPLCDEITRQLK